MRQTRKNAIAPSYEGNPSFEQLEEILGGAKKPAKGASAQYPDRRPAKKRDSEKNPLWQGFSSGLHEAASSRRPGVSGSWLLTVLRECAIALKGSNELCLKHQ